MEEFPYILDADMSFLRAVPNVVACIYQDQIRDTKVCFFLLGRPPLKETLTNLFNNIGKVTVFQRHKSHMSFEASLGNFHCKWAVSFEAFDSIEHLLKHFEWVLPVLVRTHDKVFYTSYFKDCLENDWVLSSVYGGMYHDSLRDLNIDYPITCSSCKLDSIPLWNDLPYGNNKFIDDVVKRRDTRSELSLTLPTNWHDEHIPNRSIADHFGLPNDNLTTDGIVESLFKKLPYLNELRKVRLPFEYIEPMVIIDLLCPVCLTYYKPVWSWGNMKYYKDDAIELYLILSKHGLPWDIVIQVLAFKVDLDIYDEAKDWLDNERRVTDELALEIREMGTSSSSY